MKLGIMQPYFLPYIGYFQLIAAVDTYIIYDDVNYIKGGWINRNNFLINEQKKMLTVSLDAPSPNKLIREIDIKDNFIKFKKSIELSYKKAPYFNEATQLLDLIISYNDKNLAKFIGNSLRLISEYLGFNTGIRYSSDIKKTDNLSGDNRVIDICNILGATEYINAIGGQELYSKDKFKDHGIDLSFLSSELIRYEQFKNEFIPGLSILDVLMFNDKNTIRLMIDNYKLV